MTSTASASAVVSNRAMKNVAISTMAASTPKLCDGSMKKAMKNAIEVQMSPIIM